MCPALFSVKCALHQKKTLLPKLTAILPRHHGPAVRALYQTQRLSRLAQCVNKPDQSQLCQSSLKRMLLKASQSKRFKQLKLLQTKRSSQKRSRLKRSRLKKWKNLPLLKDKQKRKGWSWKSKIQRPASTGTLPSSWLCKLQMAATMTKLTIARSKAACTPKLHFSESLSFSTKWLQSPRCPIKGIKSFRTSQTLKIYVTSSSLQLKRPLRTRFWFKRFFSRFWSLTFLRRSLTNLSD